jgi:hypothetical protein
VGVLASSKGGARRNADRIVRIAVTKPSSRYRKPVDVGRLNNWMAIAAQHLRAVLVSHDDQEILGFHIAIISLSAIHAQRHDVRRDL